MIDDLSLKIRFTKYTERMGECLIWIGAKRLQGRGYISPCIGYKRKVIRATTVAWFLHYGTWPTQNMLHHCDNSICVEWSHLFEGSQRDNIKDSIVKGRYRSLTCRRGHLRIPYKRCRECTNIRQRRYTNKRKV